VNNTPGVKVVLVRIAFAKFLESSGYIDIKFSTIDSSNDILFSFIFNISEIGYKSITIF
jgi:hypothetical protein